MQFIGYEHSKLAIKYPYLSCLNDSQPTLWVAFTVPSTTTCVCPCNLVAIFMWVFHATQFPIHNARTLLSIQICNCVIKCIVITGSRSSTSIGFKFPYIHVVLFVHRSHDSISPSCNDLAWKCLANKMLGDIGESFDVCKLYFASTEWLAHESVP